MIISEKHDEIVKEFFNYGELLNNIKLLHYGQILLEVCQRSNCSLEDLLQAISEVAQKQIRTNNLGRAVL